MVNREDLKYKANKEEIKDALKGRKIIIHL